MSIVVDPVDEEQSREIPQPLGELAYHVTLKAVQTGSVLAVASGSLSALRHRSLTAAAATITRSSPIWIGFTTIGSLIATGAKLNSEQWSQYKIWDRAYRIRHNVSQQHVDQYSGLGALGGMVGAYVLMNQKTTVSAVRLGVPLGVTAAVIAHMIVTGRPEEQIKSLPIPPAQ